MYFNFSRNLSQLVETDPLKPIRAVIDAKTISFLSRLSHLFKLLRDQVLETKLIFRIQNQLALTKSPYFALSHQFSITEILVINVPTLSVHFHFRLLSSTGINKFCFSLSSLFGDLELNCPYFLSKLHQCSQFCLKLWLSISSWVRDY